MIASEGERIDRDFKRRNDRKTIIKSGEVRVEFMHVVIDGKDTVVLNLPPGWKIEHINLTEAMQNQ